MERDKQVVQSGYLNEQQLANGRNYFDLDVNQKAVTRKDAIRTLLKSKPAWFTNFLQKFGITSSSEVIEFVTDLISSRLTITYTNAASVSNARQKRPRNENTDASVCKHCGVETYCHDCSPKVSSPMNCICINS